MAFIAVGSEIRKAQSPVGAFFRTTFPHVDRIAQDVDLALRRQRILRPAAGGQTYPWATVGSAIDYRLRFSFQRPHLLGLPAFWRAKWWSSGDEGTIFGGARVPVYPYGRGTGQSGINVPPAFADLWEEVATTYDHIQPMQRRLTGNEERVLCRLCVGLALFDQSMVDTSQGASMPIRRLPPGAPLADVLALATDEMIADVAQLSQLFADRWVPRLSLRTVQPNPQFQWKAMSASADLLIDDCLIDIKTTVRSRLDPLWLYQLLAYVLLDEFDRCKARRAGFYFSRHGTFVVWPIDRLVQCLTGSTGLTVDRLRPTLQSAALASASMRWAMR